MTQTFEQWQSARAARAPRAPGRTIARSAPADSVAPSAPALTVAAPIASAAPASVVEPSGLVGASPGAAAREARRLLARARDLVARADAILAPLPAESEQQDESALVECVDLCERVAAMVGVAQRRASVAYRGSRIAAQRTAGVAARDLGRGVAEEIAMARRITPTAASNQLALGRILVTSLPRTTALLAQGEISGWAADEVAKAVLTLGDADRARVDEGLADRLPALTPRRAGAMARARAAELDQEAALARMRREVAQRSVSIRPVSDALVRISALLPTADGVAVYAELDRAARGARAGGDARSRGQHMADTLFQRVTGLEGAEHAPIELQLLMTDRALLGDGEDTAWIEGHPIPAAIARRLAVGEAEPEAPRSRPGSAAGARSDPAASAPTVPIPAAPGSDAQPPEAFRTGSPPRPPQEVERWIRRLYTDPSTGALTAADARRRLFSGAVRRYVILRDQHCRGPWCDGAIAQVHHVEGWARGGTTIADNGVGACERFNLAVEMPGWSTTSGEDGALIVRTPTGREYRTDPPDLRPSAARERGSG